MRKKLIRIATALVALLCAIVSLCACSNYNRILKAFEKEDYKENTSIQQYVDQFSDLVYSTLGKEDEEKEEVATIHYLTRGILSHVVIIEFKDSNTLKEKYEDSKFLQTLISDLQHTDFVNGNCVLVLYTMDGLEIFKKA